MNHPVTFQVNGTFTRRASVWLILNPLQYRFQQFGRCSAGLRHFLVRAGQGSFMTAEVAQAADEIEAAPFDALIIGAGFSGLYALYRLRRLGLRARVLEMAE